MAAIGTIGQGFRRGTAHFWGTGFDAKLRAFGNKETAFAPAPGTNYVIHAARGPNTRRLLLENEIHAPAVYGDPGWFLPRILNPKVEKTIELGVIPHISGLATKSATAQPKADRVRMRISPLDGVRVVPTYHQAGWEGFKAQLETILSCKRIVSTSFHGLILADAYRIPCLYFPPRSKSQAETMDLAGGEVDHRVADFYLGAGRKTLPAFGQPTSQETPWDRVIAAVDAMYEPTTHRSEAALFEAFPFNSVVNYEDVSWKINEEDMAAIPF
ncbi:polysaccharide pyruvyl transferase family protein [Roseomonas sp. 18066]|uniref:polysaccharide pyruvyl transferase family protein n=1 Tax=Roseomonas sp. 18066 TaxID=2681412 RepID=UPI00135A463E|nr:polysaccharide pyruvyl transferase family protein [Roseomonas sp. 18066]